MEDHIRFDAGVPALDLLDQRLLPAREERFLCRSVEDVCFAIREMVVRGAPAIGVAAAFGCALAAAETASGENRAARLEAALDRLAGTRPTAVNLAWAVERQREVLRAHPEADPETLFRLFTENARRIQAEDIAACRAMGRAALELVRPGDCILTHCNAGALATAGYGTALGVVRAAWEAGLGISVIADETRPLFQGARLTAWELSRDGIPVTIACDSSCAWLMRQGRVQLVVTGADRIAANGDAANKIGTLGVALLARHFHIPFYVAAPVSTIDPAMPCGDAIPIEERGREEVAAPGGRPVAPEGVPVFNYAFDVTPADCITAIITERGLLRPPYTEAIAALRPGRI